MLTYHEDMFLKLLVVRGILFLFAAPTLILGQSSPAAAPPPGIRPIPNQRPTYISPNEFLSGLTLTNDQKAKINTIREEARSHLTAVAKDQKLGPEVKDAMIGGFQRIENSKIFQVLTPGQQLQVRRRIATLRAAEQQPKQQSQLPPVPEIPQVK